MKSPKALAMISITLTAILISGCGITIAQSSSNSSYSESRAPASNSPEQNVSDLPSTPQIISTPASSALSEALSNTSESFWLLANHEQYLTGVVTDCHFETYPQKSYICFTSNGQEYRIEGSLGQEGEGLLQFHNQGSYSGKDSEECHSGWYIVAYFEDDLTTGQTTITQPKDIFLSASEDVYNQIPKVDYSLSVLHKNFDDIDDKRVFIPSEAMQRVSDYAGLNGMQKQSLSAGVYIYTNGQHTLSFQGLHYNDYYHLDRETAAKIYSDDPILSVKYRDTSFPGDGITSQPFIEYEIIDKHGDNTDFYYVTISGEVSPLQTLYDMDDGVLIKK